MTERDLLSAIRHGDRPFHNPLKPELVDEVCSFAGLGPGGRGTMGFALILNLRP